MTCRRLLYNRSLCSRLLILVLIVATICAAGAGVGMSADITVTSFNTTLSNNTPANGTSIFTPTISINATNTVSGINTSSAKMTVEGMQVTLTSTGSGPIFKFMNTSASTYAHGDTVNVTFNVSNSAGNMTNASWMFYIDNVNPTISITSPVSVYFTTASSINVSGIANGTGSPPNVTVNGTSIPFTPGLNITFEANVSLSLGTNTIYANITDAAGNINSTNITIIRNPELGAGSDIITVGGGGSGAEYTSIQAAIDNAIAGDTILVYNGTYIENVVVKKRLTIRSVSENPADTIVQAVTISDVFEVYADYVNISGFAVRGTNSGKGISINGMNCNISNNTVTNNFFSIWVSKSGNNTTLLNNNVSNNSYGIVLGSNNNTLLNNDISNSNYTGIQLLATVSNNTLTNNTVSNNKFGIILDDFSNNNTLNDNDVLNNSYEGIELRQSNNNTVSGNNVSNNFDSGIRLEKSNYNTLNDNDALNNSYEGIELSQSNNNNVRGNDATGNNEGISLLFSDNNILDSNNISKNSNGGIQVYSSKYNTLSGNNVSKNSYFGIRIYSSENSNVTNNVMTDNRYNFGVDGDTDSDFDNQIDTSNLVDGRPVYYIKYAIDTVYDSSTNAGTFYCISCTNVTIKHLNFDKNIDGVLLWNTSSSKIQNVTTRNNRGGITLVNSSNNLVNGSNALNSSFGIYLSNSSNNVLNNNNANYNNYAGIAIMVNSSNNIINGNNANNNLFGIYAIDTDSPSGSEMSPLVKNTLVGNNASNNKYGIIVFISSENVISSNTANYNDYFGIALSECTNNTLANNNASHNNIGFILSNSTNNTMDNNNASYNFDAGIKLNESSSNNKLTNNSAIFNTFGIALENSAANILYTNYLANNINSDAYDNTSSNQWDSGTKGNYYSDYTGSDSNGDGIGDTPYTIPGGGSMDNYPRISLTTLSDKTPASGTSILTPTISINATNTVFGINASSAKMTVGGVQVILTPTSSGDTFTFTDASATTYAHGNTVNVTFNVSDNAGNTASTSWMFYIDNVNPTINITSPADYYSTTAGSITVSGTVNGTGSPPTATVNGITAVNTTNTTIFKGTFSATASLSMGANAIYANVTDAAGNTNSILITVTRIPTSGGNRGHSDSGETLRIISTAADDDAGEETASDGEKGDIVNAPKDRGTTDGDNADENDFGNNDGRDETTFKTRPFEAKLPLYAGFGIISLLLTFVGVLRSRGWKL